MWIDFGSEEGAALSLLFGITPEIVLGLGVACYIWLSRKRIGLFRDHYERRLREDQEFRDDIDESNRLFDEKLLLEEMLSLEESATMSDPMTPSGSDSSAPVGTPNAETLETRHDSET